MRFALFPLAIALFASTASAAPFIVQVVDDQTGRGVPLVELRAPNHLTYFTDSAGIAAIDDPVLNGRTVWFEVKSHGYEYLGRILGKEPQVALTLKPGGRQQLKIHRRNLAERLYRLTGAGIYQDSVAAGLPVPIREPLLNAGVLGQDTAVALPYRGRLFWIWGDTLLPAGYNFAVSAATALLPASGGLDPSAGVNFQYFTNAQGQSRPMLPLPRKGLVWIEGLFVVADPTGADRLLATYTRQQGLTPPEECGIALYNDSKQLFEPWRSTACGRSHVSAHPFRHTENGRQYWYLYPLQRVPNNWQAVQDPKQWESFTPNASGAWAWRAGAARLDPKSASARFPLIDTATGKPSLASPSSVIYNQYRQCWILLAERAGDVFYSEAPRPEGPWLNAVRILTHDNHNFYNVVMHPFFTAEQGRVIYFEGTYTGPAPRYHYNQLLYRLRLSGASFSLRGTSVPPK